MSSSGNVSVLLLTAKSKVAPKGTEKLDPTMHLPRIELCGALFLSHLFEKVESSLQIIARPFFWTDSTIVVHWLAASPSRWKKFVGNRVAEIQQITASVSGIENTADVECQQWSWWNTRCGGKDPSGCNNLTDFGPVYLVRLVAYMRRFCSNTKKHNQETKRSRLLSTVELENALVNLVKLAQPESFVEDLHSVRTTGQVKSTSKLKALSTVLVNGVLPTRGRLNNATISYAQKQPMILDNKHPFTLLVVWYYHLSHLHAGPTLLIATVRAKFWPLRLRDVVRKVTHECITCFRNRPSFNY
ncbi:uncharacterized protein LOC135710770 [Ochlerotatus camptorhynchus]|uniref:uncharacterized protein LOC135710770 n=1 Tax=Ochlerotatus camptorhynchus TaxID=644619 RepID=UPI0031E084E8